MKKRVLVVEDDEALAQVVSDITRLRRIRREPGRRTAIARSRAAASSCRIWSLLDLTLPGRSGFDLCQILRRNGRAGVIILTARGQKADTRCGTRRRR